MTAAKPVNYSDYSVEDRKRLANEPVPSAEDPRGPFERDRARIIHSAAFRRLQGKTQVYGLGASDYYRTRLTHSLEVSQIGKALALRLEADTALVEAICLAHDIGHPPFGHAGESALHTQLAEIGGFNGNAQNLRVLLAIERKSNLFRGLNLTKATLDGIIKYPQVMSSATRASKGYYEEDAEVVKKFKIESRRSFECEIMDWADDVAYSSHDLEDALVIGTVRMDEMSGASVLDEILAVASKAYGRTYPEMEARRRITATDVDEAVAGISTACFRRGADRIAAIKTFIGQHINDCVVSASRQLIPHAQKRYSATLVLDENMVRRVEIYKAIHWVCVIMTNAVLSLQQAGRAVVEDLFRFYSDESNDLIAHMYVPDWSSEVRDAIAAVKSGQDAFALKRLARDYVASMTDKVAEEQWRKLKLPGEGHLFIARV